jgi:predicted  nucleic acid-binding Zn-ribbon protein
MEDLTAGTLAGTGSFRCDRCGYVMTLSGGGTLPPCPSCASERFVRASLFPSGQVTGATAADEEAATEMVAAARELVTEPVAHVGYRDGDTLRVHPITRDLTRIGRSLAADIRFDDATVSRRHALIVRQPDGLRVVDDRSLNGVHINGTRVEWRTLRDGDELTVGRHRLVFLAPAPAPRPRHRPVAPA